MIKLPKSLTTVTPFSKLLAGILFFTFIISAFFAGMKYQAMMDLSKYQQSNLVTAKPSPTPTPDPTANWKTYISQKFGFSIKYPSSWVVKNNLSQDPYIYIDSDIKASWGNPPSDNNSGIVFYVFIAQALNPTNKQFKDLVTQDLSNDLKNIFTYTQDKIGQYIVYETDKLPSAYGALNAYITLDDSKYITVGLAPYDKVKPPNNQNKVLPLFNQILSTFKFTQ